MSSDLNTMMQEMKTGFRRIELNQAKFEENKRKNMDKYFQQVLNQKKQRYYEELQQQQSEGAAKGTTVEQLTSRVQNLKRHIHSKGNQVSAEIKDYKSIENKRGRIKFTDAGFPIHDYIKEMREEREEREYKKSL